MDATKAWAELVGECDKKQMDGTAVVDRDRVMELADGLYEWICKGGHLPKGAVALGFTRQSLRHTLALISAVAEST